MTFETHPLGRATLDRIDSQVFPLWAPPKEMLISEWAMENRTLPKGTTPRPGPYRPDAFQVGILDALCDPGVTELVVLKSTQVGYSEILNCIIGFFIDQDPRPMMLVQPTIEDAKGYSKKRIAPLIENTPTLKAKVRTATSRKSGNTLLLKEFPGGFLKMAGANSGTGLRSDPVGLVVRDEADAYPEDVDGEGNPLEISRRRTDQYPDAKIITGGTPGKPKGFSPVEKAYLEASMGRFHVPCPHCGELQPLQWRDPQSKTHRLVYALDDKGKVDPATVGYACCSCGALISEREKYRMVKAGKWVHADPENPVRGFHLNALYSVAKDNWVDLAREWEKAKRDQSDLKAFVNLRLGETWEEDGDQVEADSLRGRLEGRERGTIPAAAGATTGFVDVQGNRLEAQVKAWGPGEESWLVDWAQFYGDPSTTVPWEELDAWLLQGFKREISGAMVQPDLTLIDAKYTAGAVYDFVQPRQNRARMVFASNGVEHLDRPGLAKVGTARKARVRLYLIATDAAKTRIMSRLKIQTKGPGYIHLPDWVTEEYLEQLTAERLVPRLDPKTKRVKRTWIKLRNRNEALDLEVGCLAGLFILQEILFKGGRFKDLAKRSELRQKPEGAEGETAAPVTPPPSPPAPIIRKPPANRFPLRPMGSGWRKGGGSW